MRLALRKLSPLSSCLLVLVFALIILPEQHFPKIFSDEMGGIDFVRQIGPGNFPNYTGYPIGLGLILWPFYLLTHDPQKLYDISLWLNVFTICSAMLLLYKILENIKSTQSRFLIFVGFSYTGTLIAMTRTMTESFATLFGVFLMYKWNNLRLDKVPSKFYLVVVPTLFGFFSVIHQRLLFLCLFSIAYELWFTRLLRGRNKYLVTGFILEILSLVFFQVLNFQFKGSGGSLIFLTEIRNHLESFLVHFLIVLLGHIWALTLVSLGIVPIALVLVAMPSHQGRTSAEKTLLLDAFRVTFFSLLVSALFMASLTTSKTWGETVATAMWATRYFDPFVPIIIVCSLVWLISSKAYQKIHLGKLSWLLVGLLILGFLTSIHFNPMVQDPVRSPMLFHLTAGEMASIRYQFFFLFVVLVIGFVTSSNPDWLAWLLIPFFLFCCVKPLGWSAGIELGFQKNHNLATLANQILDHRTGYTATSCVDYIQVHPENWWSNENYKYWIKYPVLNRTDPSGCTLIITDKRVQRPEYLLLSSEKQATMYWLYTRQA